MCIAESRRKTSLSYLDRMGNRRFAEPLATSRGAREARFTAGAGKPRGRLLAEREKGLPFDDSIKIRKELEKRQNPLEI